MRIAILAALCCCLLSACELFVIGSTQSAPTRIERSQRSSISAIRLWCDELDSASTAAATDLMLHPSGRALLALEKHEMADDLARWKRRLSGKPITSYSVDTTTASAHTVDVTFDYIRRAQFQTLKKDNLWYIIKVMDR